MLCLKVFVVVGLALLLVGLAVGEGMANGDQERVVVLTPNGQTRVVLGPGEKVASTTSVTIRGMPFCIVRLVTPAAPPDLLFRLPNGQLVPVSKKKIADDVGTIPDRVTVRQVTDQAGDPVGWEATGTMPNGAPFSIGNKFKNGAERLDPTQPIPDNPAGSYLQPENPVPVSPMDEAEMLARLGIGDDPTVTELVEVPDGEFLLGSDQGTEQIQVNICEPPPSVVGGTTSFFADSSSYAATLDQGPSLSAGSIATLAGTIIGALAIVVAASWYAKRRWIGKPS